MNSISCRISFSWELGAPFISSLSSVVSADIFFFHSITLRTLGLPHLTPAEARGLVVENSERSRPGLLATTRRRPPRGSKFFYRTFIYVRKKFLNQNLFSIFLHTENCILSLIRFLTFASNFFNLVRKFRAIFFSRMVANFRQFRANILGKFCFLALANDFRDYFGKSRVCEWQLAAK